MQDLEAIGSTGKKIPAPLFFRIVRQRPSGGKEAFLVTTLLVTFGVKSNSLRGN